jgi:hypothetical protein
MIIAVDFDGVIYDGWCEIDTAIDTLKYVKGKGHRLILWTCKSERRLGDVVDWCRYLGLEFDAVNACVPNSEWFCHPKVYADVYLDDRSFPPFSGWAEFRKWIDENTPAENRGGDGTQPTTGQAQNA